MSSEKKHLTFLSYSRINKDFALQLARELKSSGFNVWIDQIDIPTGARWDDELEKALEECEVFMVILTPASSASDNVKDEIGYAIDTNKRILPILLENANVPLRLRRFQYVDFTGKTYDEGVEGAKQQLKKLIDEPTSPQPQLSPAEQAQKAESDRLKKEKIVAHKVETARKVEDAATSKAASAPLVSEKPTPVASSVTSPKTTPDQSIIKKFVSKPLMIGIGVVALLVIFGVVGVILYNDSVGYDDPSAYQSAEESGVIPNTGEDSGSDELNGYNVTYVSYDGGEFSQVSDTEWYEAAYVDEAEFFYEEVDRDEWSVYLYDPSRDLSIHLDLYTGEILYDDNTGQGEFLLHYIEDAQ